MTLSLLVGTVQLSAATKQAEILQLKEQDLSKQTTHAVAGKEGRGGEVMIIAPELRAKDLQHAFTYLKRVNSAAKIAVKLTDGGVIFDILSMELMPGGTIIIFQTSTTQGVKYHVVNIENIDSIRDV